MLNIGIIFLTSLMLLNPPIAALENQSNKISELRLYSDSGEALTLAEGMMEEIIVTAEYTPSGKSANQTNRFQQFNDYFTFVVNVLIVLFFIGIGITTLLSKKRRRKIYKKEKGPLSLPPFSDTEPDFYLSNQNPLRINNIDLGKDYAC